MTHHNRPGGRVVELLAALVLIFVSVGLFLAVLAGVLWLFMQVAAWKPVLAFALVAASVNWLVLPVFRFATRFLATIWRPFLSYYRYEAHSLRPLPAKDQTDR